MKKRLVVFLIGIFSLCSYCYSQERLTIDYPTIKEYVTNQHEEFQKLMQRFEMNDSLLTRKELAIIYYGYSFTPDYTASMFNLNDDFIKVRQLAKEGKNEEAYEIGTQLLKKNPVSLALLHKMGTLAYALQKETQEIKNYSRKYATLTTMIAFTGDGHTEETAFKVICVDDEYQLLHMLFRMEHMKSQSLVNKCDLIEFERCKYYPGTQMYFDISRSLDYMSELFKK